MKEMVKKLLKVLLVMVTSMVVVYLMLTIPAFYSWCDENQLLVDSDEILSQVDPSKIQELGNRIGLFEQLMKEDLQNIQNGIYEEGQHSLAEYYDPLGCSVWSYMRLEIQGIINNYFMISILSGVAITIAYVVITSKKMNSILKFAIGYFGVMLMVPPIYMYSWTYRFWDIFTTYGHMPKYFYIGYTVIFVLMYVVNYRVGTKMAKELNNAIKENETS